MTDYYDNYMFPMVGGCGCGGIPANLSHINNLNTSFNPSFNTSLVGGGSPTPKSMLVVPGGLVCIPRIHNNPFVGEHAVDNFGPSEHTISDTRFDQLLKRVSEPLPFLLTKALNVDSPTKSSKSSKFSKSSNKSKSALHNLQNHPRPTTFKRKSV